LAAIRSPRADSASTYIDGIASGKSSEVVAIEHPEIHLHPALQAELGDLFLDSALGEDLGHGKAW